MHRSLILICFCVVLSYAQAQTVFIPDPQFRVKLNEWAPGLVDANGYMPEDNAGMTPDSLSLHIDWSPNDLTGIESLGGVIVMNISGSVLLDTQPFLPEGLEILYLTNLPWYNLPSTLSTAYLETVPEIYYSVNIEHVDIISPVPGSNTCIFNDLPLLQTVTLGLGADIFLTTNTPALTSVNLPTGLISVLIQNTGLSDIIIPDMNPISPTYLNILDNPALLTVEVGNVAPNTTIEISNSPLLNSIGIGEGTEYVTISATPALTDVHVEQGFDVFLTGIYVPEVSITGSFLSLGIVESSIVSLSNLPTSLTSLSLVGMSQPLELITPQGLILLNVEGVDQTVLDMTLNEGLEHLVLVQCGNSTLPELPTTLQYLSLNSCDQLHCLPILPDGLSTFLTFGNAFIQCKPNHPSALVDETPVLPLCTILNSYCRDPSPVISGIAFRDDNGNGTQDLTEPTIPNATIIASPSGYMTGTDSIGYYELGLPIGTHQIVVDAGPFVLNVEPDQNVVDLLSIGEHLPDQNFAIEMDLSAVDLEVSSVWSPVLRPGFVSTFTMLITNNGYDAPEAELQLSVQPELELVECSIIPTISGGTLSWPFAPLAFGADMEVTCTFAVLSSMALGTEVITTATILTAVDDDLSNNSAFSTDTVVGSYDPNDKQVFPATLTVEEGITGTEIEYLIRFQNTGTYLAERVLITDTLSTDLITQTLQFVGSSHPCTWFYREGALHIVYNEIMLPDSNSNEPESHGFALFKIDTRDQLMVGDQIENVANIYFDFNEPVITEAAVLTVELPTALEANSTSNAIVHPVPSSGLIEIRHDGSWNGANLFIRDLEGRLILNERIEGMISSIDISSLAAGVYLIDLQLDGRNWSQRIIKE